jgi:hypothetical protein
MRVLAATLLAALLAGCAAQPGGLFGERVYGADHFAGYLPQSFSAFAAAGPVVEVRGAPPGGATAEAVAEALRLPGYWPQTPFRSAGATPEDDQRIVLIFGAMGAGNPLGACRSDGGGIEQPADQPLRVYAAYCNGRGAWAGAKLDAATPLGPGDPGFTEAMERLFFVLAPVQDPSDRFRNRKPLWLLLGG